MSGSRAKNQRKQGKARGVNDWSALDRAMFQDDCNWIASLGYAVEENGEWAGAMGLALAPHMARIAYEGMQLLRKQRPAQAHAVNLKYGAAIEASRHTLKLLDDREKLYDGVLQDFERLSEGQVTTWLGKSYFELGLIGDRIITTSRSVEFQQSARFGGSSLDRSNYSNGFGRDVGQAVVGILRQFGFVTQPIALSVDSTVDLPITENVEREEYYESRFEPEFPLALKDVLCVAEGSVNSCLAVFAPVSGPFIAPVFRVQFVTASHTLSALEEIHTRFAHLADRPSMKALAAVLDSPEARRIASLRKLRNRCMHYGIPANLQGLGRDLPMYGLVEATSPDTTFAAVDADLQAVLLGLSDLLHQWTKP